MNPEDDGKTHINIYSKGKTPLGRMLSNFERQMIETEDGVFWSVEGYWYWLLSKHPARDELRKMSGNAAKKRGRELGAMDWPLKGSEPVIDPVVFRRKIRAAVWNKIDGNLHLKAMLGNSTLPLVHYYTYGDKVVVPHSGKFVIRFIERCRKFLQSQ